MISTRICFFGDSFVNGTGDDDALGWVGRVVARARQGGRDVTAYNLGIRRETSVDIAARWKREAVVRLPPDADGRLVFSFGANDCTSLGPGAGPRVAAADSVAHARAVLADAPRWLPTLMIGPAVIAGDAAATARVCALSADYAAACLELSVPYLDVSAALANARQWADEAARGDGVHPNRGGYSMMADLVADWEPWRRWVEAG